MQRLLAWQLNEQDAAVSDSGYSQTAGDTPAATTLRLTQSPLQRPHSYVVTPSAEATARQERLMNMVAYCNASAWEASDQIGCRICGLPQDAGIGKKRNVKLASWFAVGVLGAIFVTVVYTVSAEEPTASPTPSVSDTEDDTTKEADFVSPNGKFAFLIGRGEDQQTIDLIDNKTKKVLQHVADDDVSSVSYKILWSPNSKRFALMTRAGHPNQGVTVYFLKGDKFQEIKIPDLTVEIPARIRAGKEHPHVAANDWQEAKKWIRGSSLLLTIDNTIDGAGHTASATRTVLLGFDKSGKPKILKSTVKYESRNDED